MLRDLADDVLQVTAGDFHWTNDCKYSRSLRPSLGRSAAEVAWATGRAMGLDDAASYALSVEPAAAAPTHTGPQVSAGPLTPREEEIAVLVARGRPTDR
jgi:DNA-binding NarL/FixJ family response regulator